MQGGWSQGERLSCTTMVRGGTKGGGTGGGQPRSAGKAPLPHPPGSPDLTPSCVNLSHDQLASRGFARFQEWVASPRHVYIGEFHFVLLLPLLFLHSTCTLGYSQLLYRFLSLLSTAK